MSEPIYHLQNVSKKYNGRTVLKVDDLDIYPGEVLALVGPSGAGKSTLLRLLNFLEPPSSGAIDFQGFTFNQQQVIPLPLRRQVTTVFQRPMLLNRSVLANIQYGLRLRSKRDIDSVTRAALHQVGLHDLARQRAQTLSGGEAQRVALARAIVLQPKVLLLDEPTANLDPYNVSVIEDTIMQLNRDSGTTLVLVTHNVFQARRLAQRVALMLEGEIIEVDEAHKFFESPRQARTAAFVAGEMIY